MTLRYLPNTEMVALTRTWVDTAHADHQLLMFYPLTAALMPEIIAAHGDVLVTRPVRELVLRLDEIQDEQKLVDNRFDDVYRGLWYRLLAEEYLASDPDTATRFRALRNALMPDGLRVVNYPYRQEVGYAEMIASKLTPEQEQDLTALATHDGDLLQSLREWFTVADELGALDHERNGILPDVEGASPGDTGRARGRWMRVVDLVRRSAEVIGEDPRLDELLGRIEKAEEQAAQRIARRRRTESDATPDAESPADAGSETTADADSDSTANADSDSTADAGSESTADAAPEPALAVGA